jgi:Lon protease-like protein
MLPASLPLFPLPRVVLFPNVFLPLHIFEPRYRQMVEEALAGDRMIGMVLLKPGYEPDYEGAPPIYGIGCAGLITHAERLEDGRYNLILRGLEKFTVTREETPAGGRLYRSAVVTTVMEPATAAGDRDRLRAERQRLEALLTPVFSSSLEHSLPQSMADEDVVNALAQYLEFEPLEKLALLEREGALARCRSMLELLEMKAMLRDGSNGAGTIH